MGNRLTITIKKRSQTGNLIWLIVILPFFFSFLVNFLGLPYYLRYSLDVAWVLLVVYLLLSRQHKSNTGFNKLSRLVLLFLIYTAVTYVVQYQSAFYYLWGLRSNFRFYVAFLAVAAFLKEDDVSYYFKAIDVFFWINVVVTLVQYYAFGLYGDHLGGLFGTETGANGYTVIFFSVVATKSLVAYLAQQESFGKLALKSVAILWIAALAEIKFFFAVFMMIVALAVLFTNFTWRKFWVVIGSVVLALVFVALLESMFPFFKGFFSLTSYFESATSNKGYTGRGDMNRLTAIPLINEHWLTSFGQQLFGYGLGNCDSAGFDFLVTPFHERYAGAHYTWFSHAFMYLETGWIGLAFFYGFFILTYIELRKIEKRSKDVIKHYCLMGRILTICCIVLSIYNQSLRTEAGYMMFFALAVPFALDREQRRKLHAHDKTIATKNSA